MVIRFKLNLIKSKIIGVIMNVLFLIDNVMWELKMYNCRKHVLELQRYCDDYRWKILDECWEILEILGKTYTED